MNDLNALDEKMKEKYSKDDFSVYGYKEGAVCLEKNGANWVVYKAFRGRKKDPTVFRNMNDAYLGMMIMLDRGF